MEGHVERGTWLLVVGAIVLMTALAIWDLNNDPEPPASSSAPPPPAESPCPADVDEEPHSSKFTNRAPPYEGPAPHPVEVVNVTGISQANEPPRILPDGWEPTVDSLRETQLVVCEYLASTGAIVDSCEYAGNQFVPLVSAVWTYRVLEARTAKQVTEFMLNGTDTCPASIEYLEGHYPSNTPQFVRDEELANALRPFVAP
jgi:hypothetical protein